MRGVFEDLHNSYFFVPFLMLAASVGLWVIGIWLDRRFEFQIVRVFGAFYSGGPEGARSVLSLTAQSMITIAGVVFSITVVALALASQQYGPWALRNFVRDTGNQIVLGTFISTFIYCTLVLWTVRSAGPDFVPYFSITVGMLLLLASIGVLVYFINHMAKTIQAPHIIARIYNELENTVNALLPEPGSQKIAGASRTDPGRTQDRGETGIIRARSGGYIKEIEIENILALASAKDLVFHLISGPGNYVVRGEEIVRVSPPGAVDLKMESKINDFFVFGSERTSTQDIEFAFNELSQIAVRSLSPGINDPFTAILCIDRVASGLALLGERPPPHAEIKDKYGHIRIFLSPISFCSIVEDVFTHLRPYACLNSKVTEHILGKIMRIAPLLVRGEDKKALREQAFLLREDSLKKIDMEQDRKRIESLYETAVSQL